MITAVMAPNYALSPTVKRLLAHQVASGLSQAAYCKKYGFKFFTFRNWISGRTRPDSTGTSLIRHFLRCN